MAARYFLTLKRGLYPEIQQRRATAMVNPITRGQTACIGALAALLAALAVAPSADAATYYACVAKKGRRDPSCRQAH